MTQIYLIFLKIKIDCDICKQTKINDFWFLNIIITDASFQVQHLPPNFLYVGALLFTVDNVYSVNTARVPHVKS